MEENPKDEDESHPPYQDDSKPIQADEEGACSFANDEKPSQETFGWKSPDHPCLDNLKEKRNLEALQFFSSLTADDFDETAVLEIHDIPEKVNSNENLPLSGDLCEEKRNSDGRISDNPAANEKINEPDPNNFLVPTCSADVCSDNDISREILKDYQPLRHGNSPGENSSTKESYRSTSAKSLHFESGVLSTPLRQKLREQLDHDDGKRPKRISVSNVDCLNKADGITPSSSRSRSLCLMPSIEEGIEDEKHNLCASPSSASSSCSSLVSPTGSRSRHDTLQRVSSKPTLNSISEELVCRTGGALKSEVGIRPRIEPASKERADEHQMPFKQGTGDSFSEKSPENGGIGTKGDSPSSDSKCLHTLAHFPGGEGFIDEDKTVDDWVIIDGSNSFFRPRHDHEIIVSTCFGQDGEKEDVKESLASSEENQRTKDDMETEQGLTIGEEETAIGGAMTEIPAGDMPDEGIIGMVMKEPLEYGSSATECHLADEFSLKSAHEDTAESACLKHEVAEDVNALHDSEATNQVESHESSAWNGTSMYSEADAYMPDEMKRTKAQHGVPSKIKNEENVPDDRKQPTDQDGRTGSGLKVKGCGSDSMVTDNAFITSDTAPPRESHSDHTSNSGNAEKADKDHKDKESQKQRGDKEKERDSGKRKRDQRDRTVEESERKECLKNAVGDVQRLLMGHTCQRYLSELRGQDAKATCRLESQLVESSDECLLSEPSPHAFNLEELSGMESHEKDSGHDTDGNLESLKQQNRLGKRKSLWRAKPEDATDAEQNSGDQVNCHTPHDFECCNIHTKPSDPALNEDLSNTSEAPPASVCSYLNSLQWEPTLSDLTDSQGDSVKASKNTVKLPATQVKDTSFNHPSSQQSSDHDRAPVLKESHSYDEDSSGHLAVAQSSLPNSLEIPITSNDVNAEEDFSETSAPELSNGEETNIKKKAEESSEPSINADQFPVTSDGNLPDTGSGIRDVEMSPEAMDKDVQETRSEADGFSTGLKIDDEIPSVESNEKVTEETQGMAMPQTDDSAEKSLNDLKKENDESHQVIPQGDADLEPDKASSGLQTIPLTNERPSQGALNVCDVESFDKYNNRARISEDGKSVDQGDVWEGKLSLLTTSHEDGDIKNENRLPTGILITQTEMPVTNEEQGKLEDGAENVDIAELEGTILLTDQDNSLSKDCDSVISSAGSDNSASKHNDQEIFDIEIEQHESNHTSDHEMQHETNTLAESYVIDVMESNLPDPLHEEHITNVMKSKLPGILPEENITNVMTSSLPDPLIEEKVTNETKPNLPDPSLPLDDLYNEVYNDEKEHVDDDEIGQQTWMNAESNDQAYPGLCNFTPQPDENADCDFKDDSFQEQLLRPIDSKEKLVERDVFYKTFLPQSESVADDSLNDVVDAQQSEQQENTMSLVGENLPRQSEDNVDNICSGHLGNEQWREQRVEGESPHETFSESQESHMHLVKELENSQEIEDNKEMHIQSANLAKSEPEEDMDKEEQMPEQIEERLETPFEVGLETEVMLKQSNNEIESAEKGKWDNDPKASSPEHNKRVNEHEFKLNEDYMCQKYEQDIDEYHRFCINQGSVQVDKEEIYQAYEQKSETILGFEELDREGAKQFDLNEEVVDAEDLASEDISGDMDEVPERGFETKLLNEEMPQQDENISEKQYSAKIPTGDAIQQSDESEDNIHGPRKSLVHESTDLIKFGKFLQYEYSQGTIYGPDIAPTFNYHDASVEREKLESEHVCDVLVYKSDPRPAFDIAEERTPQQIVDDSQGTDRVKMNHKGRVTPFQTDSKDEIISKHYDEEKMPQTSKGASSNMFELHIDNGKKYEENEQTPEDIQKNYEDTEEMFQKSGHRSQTHDIGTGEIHLERKDQIETENPIQETTKTTEEIEINEEGENEKYPSVTEMSQDYEPTVKKINTDLDTTHSIQINTSESKDLKEPLLVSSEAADKIEEQKDEISENSASLYKELLDKQVTKLTKRRVECQTEDSSPLVDFGTDRTSDGSKDLDVHTFDGNGSLGTSNEMSINEVVTITEKNDSKDIEIRLRKKVFLDTAQDSHSHVEHSERCASEYVNLDPVHENYRSEDMSLKMNDGNVQLSIVNESIDQLKSEGLLMATPSAEVVQREPSSLETEASSDGNIVESESKDGYGSAKESGSGSECGDTESADTIREKDFMTYGNWKSLDEAFQPLIDTSDREEHEEEHDRKDNVFTPSKLEESQFQDSNMSDVQRRPPDNTHDSHVSSINVDAYAFHDKIENPPNIKQCDRKEHEEEDDRKDDVSPPFELEESQFQDSYMSDVQRKPPKNTHDSHVSSINVDAYAFHDKIENPPNTRQCDREKHEEDDDRKDDVSPPFVSEEHQFQDSDMPDVQRKPPKNTHDSHVSSINVDAYAFHDKIENPPNTRQCDREKHEEEDDRKDNESTPFVSEEHQFQDSDMPDVQRKPPKNTHDSHVSPINVDAYTFHDKNMENPPDIEQCHEVVKTDNKQDNESCEFGIAETDSAKNEKQAMEHSDGELHLYRSCYHLQLSISGKGTKPNSDPGNLAFAQTNIREHPLSRSIATPPIPNGELSSPIYDTDTRVPENQTQEPLPGQEAGLRDLYTPTQTDDLGRTNNGGVKIDADVNVVGDVVQERDSVLESHDILEKTQVQSGSISYDFHIESAVVLSKSESNEHTEGNAKVLNPITDLASCKDVTDYRGQNENLDHAQPYEKHNEQSTVPEQHLSINVIVNHCIEGQARRLTQNVLEKESDGILDLEKEEVNATMSRSGCGEFFQSPALHHQMIRDATQENETTKGDIIAEGKLYDDAQSSRGDKVPDKSAMAIADDSTKRDPFIFEEVRQSNILIDIDSKREHSILDSMDENFFDDGDEHIDDLGEYRERSEEEDQSYDKMSASLDAFSTEDTHQGSNDKLVDLNDVLISQITTESKSKTLPVVRSKKFTDESPRDGFLLSTEEKTSKPCPRLDDAEKNLLSKFLKEKKEELDEPTLPEVKPQDSLVEPESKASLKPVRKTAKTTVSADAIPQGLKSRKKNQTFWGKVKERLKQSTTSGRYSHVGRVLSVDRTNKTSSKVNMTQPSVESADALTEEGAANTEEKGPITAWNQPPHPRRYRIRHKSSTSRRSHVRKIRKLRVLRLGGENMVSDVQPGMRRHVMNKKTWQIQGAHSQASRKTSSARVAAPDKSQKPPAAKKEETATESSAEVFEVSYESEGYNAQLSHSLVSKGTSPVQLLMKPLMTGLSDQQAEVSPKSRPGHETTKPAQLIQQPSGIKTRPSKRMSCVIM